MYSFPNLEPVCCSMSNSNCCFLTCIQISQEADQMVWYSYLLKNFPQFVVTHTIQGFGIVRFGGFCLRIHPFHLGCLICEKTIAHIILFRFFNLCKFGSNVPFFFFFGCYMCGLQVLSSSTRYWTGWGKSSWRFFSLYWSLKKKKTFGFVDFLLCFSLISTLYFLLLALG